MLAAASNGHVKATVMLACRHRVCRYLADHPNALLGSSIRCPICNGLRTVSQVVSSAAASGRSSPAPGLDPAPRHKILVFDDADGF